MEIDSVEELLSHGLSVPSLDLLTGCLVFEAPVANKGSMICGEVSVGAYTYFGPYSGFCSNADIGRFCSFAPGVSMGFADHPTDWLSTHPFQYDATRAFDWFDPYTKIKGSQKFKANLKRIEIGNDVWIGHRVYIRKGINIGDGAIVGAGSVVTRDVEAYSIVGGVPAKKIKMRFPDKLIERFLKLRWWDYDFSGVIKELDFSRAESALDILEENIIVKKVPLLLCEKKIVFKKDGILMVGIAE